jgi:hypothetical protein
MCGGIVSPLQLNTFAVRAAVTGALLGGEGSAGRAVGSWIALMRR